MDSKPAAQDGAKNEARDKALNDLMQKPVLPIPNEEVRNTRLRLLVVSSIAVGIGAFDLRLDMEHSSLLGLRIEGLTDASVRRGLLSITAYLLIHFLWLVHDDYLAWSMRVTGWRALSRGDEDVEPRQITIYGYWSKLEKPIRGLSEAAKDFCDLVAPLRERPQMDDVSPQTAGPYARIHYAVEKLEDRYLDKLMEVCEVLPAIHRFDHRFNVFTGSQIWRWAVFDAGLPISLALAGIVLLLLGDPYLVKLWHALSAAS